MTALKTNILGAISAGLMLIAGSVMAGKPAPTTTQIETIHGVTFVGDTMTIDVTSHGCTVKEDLQVLTQVIKGVGYMTINRLRPDACNGVAQRVSFTYTYGVDANLLKTHTLLSPMMTF